MIMKTKYIIFDLDDTLMSELDYLKSAYTEIATLLDRENKHELFREMLCQFEKNENVFKSLSNKYTDYSLEKLVRIYRNHYPKLHIKEGAKEIIETCKNKGHKLGLITDGRSITQRNKLKALDIENAFDRIIISEEFGSSKPSEANFKNFISKDVESYFYIADNTKKDFITPNKLGWTSICLLDKGDNIHVQNFDFKKEYLPKYSIKTLHQVCGLI